MTLTLTSSISLLDCNRLSIILRFCSHYSWIIWTCYYKEQAYRVILQSYHTAEGPLRLVPPIDNMCPTRVHTIDTENNINILVHVLHTCYIRNRITRHASLRFKQTWTITRFQCFTVMYSVWRLAFNCYLSFAEFMLKLNIMVPLLGTTLYVYVLISVLFGHWIARDRVKSPHCTVG